MFLIILLFLFLAIPSFAVSSNQTAIDSAVNYLRTQQKTDGQIDGFPGVSDWASMAFSASNIDISTVFTTNGQTLEFYLQNNSPVLTGPSTDWSRRILAVTAANLNPYNFSGINLVDGLKTFYRNNQIGNETAVNDDVFGLLALIASRESTSSAIITDTASFIISHQHPDGSFSYSSNSSVNGDIDDTASSIISLISAKTQGVNVPDLQLSIDNAKSYLLAHQNTDGGFAYDPDPITSWDTTSNVSTTAWVTMALAALGMNNYSSFANAQNYLLSTQQSDGSFPYQPIYPPGDTFDTSYVITALEGVFWPIKIFSGTIPTITPTITPTSTPTPTPTATPTNTPTPTPTATSVSTSTPQPTSTPAPTATPEPTSTPTPTSVLIDSTNSTQLRPILTEFPTPGQILGSKTSETKSVDQQPNKKISILAIIFLGLGILSLIIHKGIM